MRPPGAITANDGWHSARSPTHEPKHDQQRSAEDRNGRTLLQRLSEVREIVPWLRPGQSYSALRRTAARLRSGAIRLADPRISPQLLADIIEKAIAQEMLVKMLAKEAVEYGQMQREMREKYEYERARRVVNDFHRLKKSPEVSDPDSRAAEEAEEERSGLIAPAGAQPVVSAVAKMVP